MNKQIANGLLLVAISSQCREEMAKPLVFLLILLELVVSFLRRNKREQQLFVITNVSVKGCRLVNFLAHVKELL
jgi:hypothetical protein